MRRSPAPKPKRPGPRVVAVRLRDLAVSLSTNSRSSSGRLHSSLGNVPPRAYLTGCLWTAEVRVAARFVPVESGRDASIRANHIIAPGSSASLTLSGLWSRYLMHMHRVTRPLHARTLAKKILRQSWFKALFHVQLFRCDTHG